LLVVVSGPLHPHEYPLSTHRGSRAFPGNEPRPTLEARNRV
jgi:hypothetical protein